jgi:hypothetical protein
MLELCTQSCKLPLGLIAWPALLLNIGVIVHLALLGAPPSLELLCQTKNRKMVSISACRSFVFLQRYEFPSRLPEVIC